MRQVIGCLPNDMSIKAIAYISGMFYVSEKDIIGRLYPATLYGEKRKSTEFMNMMNPDRPETLDNLPPAIFTTSDADFLRSYTLKYCRAYQNTGKDCTLLDYKGNKELKHAFPDTRSNLPESREAIFKITQWIITIFEESTMQSL